MTRWGRVSRGAVAATVSLFLAAFFHALAGGSLPGVAGIALCVTFSIIVCTALVGRRIPRVRLGASIAASQAMYHWLFGSLGSTEVSTGVIGHVHDAPVDFGVLSAHTHSHTDMLGAHCAAAIVTFVVIAFGERSITAAIRAARSFVLSLIPHFADAPISCMPTRLSATGVSIAAPQSWRVDHSGHRHRGPPVPSVA